MKSSFSVKSNGAIRDQLRREVVLVIGEAGGHDGEGKPEENRP